MNECSLKKKDEFKTGVKNLKNVHVDDHKIDHAIEEKYLSKFREFMAF
jgi:hypothetical protein